MQQKERLLAVGGVHVVVGAVPCHLRRVAPRLAIEELAGEEQLTIRARHEGIADAICGGEAVRLRMVAPALLRIAPPREEIVAGEPFAVRAKLFDRDGRELEVGEKTEFVWSGSGAVETWALRPAGPLFPNTGFGLGGFRARQAGDGVVVVRFGGLVGTLAVKARAPAR